MNDLMLIPGVGESLAKKLADGLGGESAAIRAIREKDIASLSEIDGISLDRAIRMVSEFSGGVENAARNKDGQKLHKAMIHDIEPFISSSPGKRKLRILQPLSVDSIEEINDRRDRVSEAISFVSKYPEAAENWVRIAKSISPLKRANVKIDRLIVVQNSDDIEHLKTVEKFARIVVRESRETWRDYEGIPRVTWIGPNQPTDIPPGWRICSLGDSLWKMIPELSLRFIESNYKTLFAMTQLRELEIGPCGIGERVNNALDGLDKLESMITREASENAIEEVRDSLWTEVKNIQTSVDDLIVAATQEHRLSLDGSEMLSYYTDSSGLQNRLKYEVSESIEFALEEGRGRLEKFLSPIGIKAPIDCFQSDYPCLFNKTALATIEQEIDLLISIKKDEILRKKVQSAILLSDKLNKSVSEIIDVDLWIGIARWSKERRCNLPKIINDSSPSCKIRGLRHPLLGVDPVPIDYGFGSLPGQSFDGSIVLLTGANSGGKTSLIEGVGIILLLAHSGLPVPSDEAEISLAEEIHIMSKVIGTQSAGALERTLIGLASIVGSDSKKFVLADELEAITEPEAAAGILAGLLDVAARNSVNAMLMVTHIGSSICKKMEFKARVDGIEAKGLDEELELIVDRVPRIGIPARSTPELILKRLEARSVGTKSEVFKSILDRL